MGVLVIKALLLAVCLEAPDFRKLKDLGFCAFAASWSRLRTFFRHISFRKSLYEARLAAVPVLQRFFSLAVSNFDKLSA